VNEGLNIFLISLFCDIVKNDPYILKVVKKIPNNFFHYQLWFLPSVFCKICSLEEIDSHRITPTHNPKIEDYIR
jgi:hypothetical protein